MIPVPIFYWVTDDWVPAMAAAAEQLGEALQDDAGRIWPTRLSAWPGGDQNTGEPGLLVASLTIDLFPLHRSPLEISDAWKARIAALPDEVRGRFHLCTIFRVVGASRVEHFLLERIRRLNLAAIELSHEVGIAVVDIDRALSFFGAESLQTDYRLQGARGAEAAGHVIAAAMLGSDLCGVVASDLQAVALRRHGKLFQMGSVVDSRLQRATRAGSS